mmetsp:Transcript_91779/g.182335  ORF Transcript_91779/g.182335 Transcript_91779/m.182335 type:complete len:108 (-) Transcript_91779:127-450(-)
MQTSCNVSMMRHTTCLSGRGARFAEGCRSQSKLFSRSQSKLFSRSQSNLCLGGMLLAVYTVLTLAVKTVLKPLPCITSVLEDLALLLEPGQPAGTTKHAGFQLRWHH